ncbi:MAG: hypothetical protein LBQ40_05340 [Clostridiales bacterium]|jgi:hypothetical protein|nr:hypothetical protein [Clostridiales bacterium]
MERSIGFHFFKAAAVGRDNQAFLWIAAVLAAAVVAVILYATVFSALKKRGNKNVG